MKDILKQVKVSELIIDNELTRLRIINPFVVSQYRQNYRTGAQFPPIVINKKTKLIVSGNHRTLALRKEFPDDHKVGVILRSYKNDREIVEDFTKENIKHGDKLSGISKKMIICKLMDLGATNDEIAVLFNLPIKRIVKVGENLRLVLKGKTGFEVKHTKHEVDTESVPVKRGPCIPQGKTMETAQYEDHKNLDRAITFDEMANQIIRWCKNGWIEKTAENVNLANSVAEHLSNYVEKIKAIG